MPYGWDEGGLDGRLWLCEEMKGWLWLRDERDEGVKARGCGFVAVGGCGLMSWRRTKKERACQVRLGQGNQSIHHLMKWAVLSFELVVGLTNEIQNIHR